MLTAFLLLIFGQFQIGSASRYSAVFTDIRARARATPCAPADFGSARSAICRYNDHSVVVTFDVDRAVSDQRGHQLAVRYRNLVGDRYPN